MTEIISNSSSKQNGRVAMQVPVPLFVTSGIRTLAAASSGFG